MISIEKLQKITAFVFDVDGVMTDGTMNVLETGEHFRVFHVRDGYAMEKAIQEGYQICVITGGKHKGVQKRMQDILKVQYLYMGSGGKNKLSIYLEFLEKSQWKEDSLLYMGDDMPDLEVMKRPSVLSTCPADAIEEIKQISEYISPFGGGKGAVRDVIEQVMKSQSKW